jgi:hypothetical protein
MHQEQQQEDDQQGSTALATYVQLKSDFAIDKCDLARASALDGVHHPGSKN